MRHDPRLARLARSSETVLRYRAAFGWLAALRKPINLLGAVASTTALILIPGRALVAWAWSAAAPALGL